MKMSLAQKIISQHLSAPAELKPGTAIQLKIDQTLTQDATGTMTYLQLERMGVDRVRTRAYSYVDHNTLQSGFMNADDHKYLQTVANRYGVYFSKAGNGICHQLHLERFAIPGQTLLGSDSHTPTCGAMAMIAIGSGGLDVAAAMAGIPYSIKMPEIVSVRLTGKLKHGVTAKDIIFKILQEKTVKGGVGKIFEYSGPGIKELSVPERSTITNMGAELGATTSLFPADENTLEYLEKQGRGGDYMALAADPDAVYDEYMEIDLDQLQPLLAAPHSPDNIHPVSDFAATKVDQICIGSCTNSSFTDLCNVAAILRGRTVHPDVSLTISFGSKQVLRMLAKNGALSDLIASGARLLEASCGPCIGMGQSPASGAVSLRTFNRNFQGRSGTMDAQVYLVSPETAAASALSGYITDAAKIAFEKTTLPASFLVDDSMIIVPDLDPEKPVVKGPNIKAVPLGRPLSEISGQVMIKVGDNITTDHIAPAGSRVLPYRSNIEKISEFCFEPLDDHFPARCKEHGGGIIIAGSNYGQGSSREHAALAPLHLGIRAVIAKSYARIHQQNLINAGIIPFVFEDEAAYDAIDLLDELEIEDVVNLSPELSFTVKNLSKGTGFTVTHSLNQDQVDIIRAGGLLNKIAAGSSDL
ncbi:MAG: aconitate hydratase [Clostridiaceae bacterium]|nr:aconitate hydratase [Clostridiaceae bacterium]